MAGQGDSHFANGDGDECDAWDTCDNGSLKFALIALLYAIRLKSSGYLKNEKRRLHFDLRIQQRKDRNRTIIPRSRNHQLEAAELSAAMQQARQRTGHH